MFLIRRLIVRPKPGRSRHLGILTAGNQHYQCAVGRGGIGINKKEGDGKSPIGDFDLISGYFRADRRILPRCPLNFEEIRRNDGWCDSPDNPNYNQPVKIPFADSHEQMFREDHLYDVCVVLDYNIFPRSKHRGSAIFLHLETPDRRPTEGCVALRSQDMMHILPRLARDARLEIKAS